MGDRTYLVPVSIPLLPSGKEGRSRVDLCALLSGRERPLPHVLRAVLENLVIQFLSGADVGAAIAAIAVWRADTREISVPLVAAGVILPDSSGLPALMDLAAARDAVSAQGGDAAAVRPTVPVTLVVDHSLIVDQAGHPRARSFNIAQEYRRNGERYAFFKWAKQAFEGLQVIPPGSGIIHQVHLEQIAHVVSPATLPYGREVMRVEFVLGCDSHTTMAGGLGMLAWGVGGIDGEAAILGLPYEIRIPRVVGLRLTGALPAGATTTDLVLTLTERLRSYGVVGDFVEVFGPGAAALSVPDRATIANMAPEYGATCTYFPIDSHTIAYLAGTGRAPAHIAEVEAHARATGLWADATADEPEFSAVIEIDLAGIVPSVAGPKRPQDRISLDRIAAEFRRALTAPVGPVGFGLATGAQAKEVTAVIDGETAVLRHGTIAIAAITSCTNTSNPSVMMAAGLIARNAVARGLRVPPYVKTSLAPGSPLVESYLSEAGLMEPLEALGFHVVGFGCTTCSGKSGPLALGFSEAIADAGLVCAAVLSGNRNFEGRIHKSVRAAYLASPPLVVAFALAGRVDVNFETEPLGHDQDGSPVMLSDVWPEPGEIAHLVRTSRQTASAGGAMEPEGARLWRDLTSPGGLHYEWDSKSSYIARPPFFDNVAYEVPDVIDGARALVVAGDSLSTDFITPSGEILPDSEAGRYLLSLGIAPEDFNAVTQRRGNHAFMARVTFANQRMKNRLAGGVEGGFTKLEPDGKLLSIFEAAEALNAGGHPAIVFAGRDYGMGSSRDWAAKGPKLLGVQVIVAESFERIHRSNVIGMGLLPMVFAPGEGFEALGLTGFERFRFAGLDAALESGAPVEVTASGNEAEVRRFSVRLDVAGPHERALLRTGGIFGAILRAGLSRVNPVVNPVAKSGTV